LSIVISRIELNGTKLDWPESIDNRGQIAQIRGHNELRSHLRNTGLLEGETKAN
jgi:hypothetical protein